jgi:hypothetical protein
MRIDAQGVTLAVLLSIAGLAHTRCNAEGLNADSTISVGSARLAQTYARYDEGSVAAKMPMRGMEIVLRPSGERRAALERFVNEQQNPKSASYRLWLTPEQFAERFGASLTDSAKIAAWLKSASMTNVLVSRGRMFVRFSGTAGAVERAFHTQIHAYNVHGQQHYANVTAPSIPATLSGLVWDVAGLHNFNPVSQIVHAASPTAQYAAGGGANNLGPADLATIYNMKALYAQGITGGGTTVAVLGQTPIAVDDYRAYREMFGLDANDFQIVAVPESGDGSNTAADLEEATLDVEAMGAVARNASIIYVWGTTAIDAAQYVVDNKLAQVMSLSYAGCEDGSAAYYETIALQANAEGITWISAAGDSGAAGCDEMLAPAASNGLAVMSPASVPEVTAVGGTAISDGSSSQYWSSTNDTQGGSALSYIPETGWSDLNMVLGGGGGASQMFAKPGYQSDFDTAVTSGRLVPDVSFSAAPCPTPYLIVYNGSSLLVAGTSAATPVFGGIAALVNHYLLAMGKIAQPGLGNINPTLYLLAERIPGVFHDVTLGSNDVPCALGTPDCAAGVLGYPAVSGYDEATGLGSLDAYALASNWANVTPGKSSLTLVSSLAQIQASQHVTFTARVTGENGNVSNSPVVFYYSNPQSQIAPASFGSAVTDGTGTATISSNIFPAGNNFVTAVFGGSTTTAAGASSNSVSVAVSAFPTVTTLAGTAGSYHSGEMATLAVTVSAPAGVALGGPDSEDAHYTPGIVSLYLSDGTLQAQSVLADDGTAALTTKALADGNTTFYAAYLGNYYAAQSQSSPITLSASSQAGAATSTTLSASATSISLGNSITLTARVCPLSGAATPTGSVTFYNGATTLANSPLNTAGVAAITVVPSLGTASITAVYGGSGAFNSSSSAAVTVTVGNMNPSDFAISGPGSATITAGSNAAITLFITPLNGFSGPILLSCTGLPSGSTCTLPAAITPQGVTAVPVTIGCAQAALAAGLPLAFFGILLGGAAMRRRKIAILAALGVVFTLTAGCGGVVISNGSSTSSSTTLSQIFTATVTATSASISHQFPIVVTVNQ